MDSIKEIEKAYQLMFNEINNKLVNSDKITKDLLIIQIKNAINKIEDILLNNNIPLDKLRFYKKLNTIIKCCISITEKCDRIGKILYKESLLSEEELSYIMENFKFLTNQMNKILEYEDCYELFIPFICDVTNKLNEYTKYLEELLSNKKIK